MRGEVIDGLPPGERTILLWLICEGRRLVRPGEKTLTSGPQFYKVGPSGEKMAFPAKGVVLSVFPGVFHPV
jgi:hypothetical protein